MTARTLLALALAAAAGAWPFATGFGRVVLVLSERHKRGIHTGDLWALPLAAAAVTVARRSRRGGDGPGGKAGAAASSSGPTDPRPTATPPPPHTLASTRGDGGPEQGHRNGSTQPPV